MEKQPLSFPVSKHSDLEQQQNGSHLSSTPGQQSNMDVCPELQSGVPQGKSRRDRFAFTPAQLQVLVHEFEKNWFPDYTKRMTLSNQLNVEEVRVHTWFTNRRARSKKKQDATKQASKRSASPSATSDYHDTKRARLEHEASQPAKPLVDINVHNIMNTMNDQLVGPQPYGALYPVPTFPLAIYPAPNDVFGYHPVPWHSFHPAGPSHSVFVPQQPINYSANFNQNPYNFPHLLGFNDGHSNSNNFPHLSTPELKLADENGRNSSRPAGLNNVQGSQNPISGSSVPPHRPIPQYPVSHGAGNVITSPHTSSSNKFENNGRRSPHPIGFNGTHNTNTRQSSSNPIAFNNGSNNISHATKASNLNYALNNGRRSPHPIGFNAGTRNTGDVSVASVDSNCIKKNNNEEIIDAVDEGERDHSASNDAICSSQRSTSKAYPENAENNQLQGNACKNDSGYLTHENSPNEKVNIDSDSDSK